MIYDSRKFTDPVPATAPDVIEAHHKFRKQTVTTMQPRTIHAEWVRENRGPWQLRELVVRGVIVKKNGELGIAAEEARFYKWGRQVDDIPPWLSVAINAAQPEGDW